VSLLSSPLRTLVALALAAATLQCAAQSPLQLDIVPEAAVLTAQSQAPTMESNPLASSSARSFLSTTQSTSSWLGSAVLLEQPLSTGAGQYTKPKIRVGLPSDSMRNFMNSVGLPAEKCQLPAVKARTKVADGDIGGTLWLYARCTFR
jgi:hypothetical protein